MRKVRTAALALIVILGSTAGFLGLSSAFRDHSRPGFGGPGRIVFGRVQLELDPTGGSSRSGREIWSMAVDGSDVRMVLAGDTSPTTPAWSPDGSRIAFLEEDPDADDLGRLRLSTSAPDGSDLKVVAGELIEPMFRVVAWSPDGARIAVLDSRAHDLTAVDDYGIPLTEIAVYALDGTRDRLVDVPGTAHGFTWWPDGEGFVVAVSDAAGDVDLVRVDLEGHVLGHLAEDVAPYPPAVSPGGDRVAFVRHGSPIGSSHVPVDDVWTVRPDGSGLTRVTDESGLKPALAWPPDGTRIVFARQTPDRCDIVSISTDGSDRTLVADRSMMGGCADELSVNGSMPLPASPEPSVVTEDALDVGMGFLVCQVSETEGQFDGEGGTDTAIVATRVGADLHCPANVDESQGYVGIDLDDDRLVDHVYGPITCEAFHCRAFAAADLDGDGGRDELLVVESGGGVLGLGVYALGAVGSPASDRTGIVRVEIGEPDLPLNGFVTGEPARLWIGDDGPWSYRLRCEDHPAGRFLYASRAYQQVEGVGLWTVDETTLVFAELRLNVFDAREPEQVAGDDPLGPPTDSLCGDRIPTA